MEQKAAAKRERELLADEASNAQFKRLRHDFQAHLNKGRRRAEPARPEVAMTQTDTTERAGTRGAETATRGEEQAAELPEDRPGQGDIDDIDPDVLLTQLGLPRLIGVNR